MEENICKHFRSMTKCKFKAKEPDGTFTDVYEVRCDLLKEGEYFLMKRFDCLDCSNCVIKPLIDLTEPTIEDSSDKPSTPEDNKKDYDVISTSSSVKPEDVLRLAEDFANGTYIPGVTGHPGATSLDADGKSLLRHYSCRCGDIELQPYIRNCNYNNIVFELVKWYPNSYYGKHNEYNIVGGVAYSKADPNASIPVSLLDIKECNYVISFVHLIKGKMIEPVSNRPSELEGEDLNNYNRLKKIAKYIVGNIIDSEKVAGENNFVTKRKEDDV